MIVGLYPETFAFLLDVSKAKDKRWWEVITAVLLLDPAEQL